jgi:gluconolactonase
MKSGFQLGIGSAILGSVVAVAQTPYTPAHLQAPRDPGYAALIATCKTPPPAAAPRGGGAPGARPGGAAPGGGAPQGAAPQGRAGGAPAGPVAYTVTGIPGVIAAGQRWKLEWQVQGNNADGILADTDGALLLAQNDNGAIVKLVNGKVTTLYRDLNTSGAMSKTPKGDLFVVERGLHNAVRQLAPQNRIHANTFNGDPLDCLGGVINDLTADSKGGVYFTHGGLFYADAKGVVTRYGENLRTNGVVLSADEKTLYVTNGNSVAAFDVQTNGSLTNQRVFVTLPSGGGDGLTIDAQGRLYITAGPNLHVAAPDGKLLGSIPSPVSLITAAFAGPDKKTMYAVTSLRAADGTQSAEVYSIPMIAEGYKGRAK